MHQERKEARRLTSAFYMRHPHPHTSAHLVVTHVTRAAHAPRQRLMLFLLMKLRQDRVD